MIALALALTVAAAAEDQGSSRQVLGLTPCPPNSRAMPVSAVQRYYPQAAQNKRLAGRVILRCTVLKSGRLADCSVYREFPEREGFGGAALKLAGLMKGDPGTDERCPVVLFPLNFTPPR